MRGALEAVEAAPRRPSCGFQHQGTDPVEIINYPDETVKLDEPTALPALREGYENRLDLFRLFTDEGAVAVYAQAGADVAHLKEMTRLQARAAP